MVGLVRRGEEPVLLRRLPPAVASLSDHLLPSYCSCCFNPLRAASSSPTLPFPFPFPCPGPCLGTTSFCSPPCLLLHLPSHLSSSECSLLALLLPTPTPPPPPPPPLHPSLFTPLFNSRLADLLKPNNIHAAQAAFHSLVAAKCHDFGRFAHLWHGSKSFSELGGTCDLRAALRLLAYHQGRQDIPKFLCSERKHEFRLGGLLSNRSKLVGALAPEDPHLELMDDPIEHPPDKLFRAASRNQEREESSPQNVGTGHNHKAAVDVDLIELASQVREAAQLIVLARNATAKWLNTGLPLFLPQEELLLAEEVIGQVITNGVQVEVDFKQGESTLALRGGPTVGTSNLGTAVYGPLFSWFNHSCRPNACYKFELKGSSSHLHPSSQSLETRVLPDMDIQTVAEDWGLDVRGNLPSSNEAHESRRGEFPDCRRSKWRASSFREILGCSAGQLLNKTESIFGPWITVRSLTRIDSGEEILISYTDLLQPKRARKLELWKKYRFICECERCSELPFGYADGILQTAGNVTCDIRNSYSVACRNGSASRLEELLSEGVEHGLSAFLADSDPWSCCCIIERAFGVLLKDIYLAERGQSLIKGSEPCNESSYHRKLKMVRDLSVNLSKEVVNSKKSSLPILEFNQQHETSFHVKVNLMHRLCLDAYMALASAYKVLAVTRYSIQINLQDHVMKLGDCTMGIWKGVQGLECCRASAAYACLLAVAVQYLYESGECGLMVNAGRLWFDAGEALLRCINELDRHCCVPNSCQHYLEVGSEMEAERKLHRLSGDCGIDQLLTSRISKEDSLVTSEGTCAVEGLHNSRLNEQFELSICKLSTAGLRNSIFDLIIHLWPMLRVGSPFLQAITNPVDLSMVSLSGSVVSGSLEVSKNDHLKWNRYHDLLVRGAFSCLQYSKYLLDICYGREHPLFRAATELLLAVN